MKRFKPLQRTLALTAAACLLCFTIAQAKKPDKPGGGGGGEDPPPHTVLELPGLTSANAISNPDSLGIVTVAGEFSEGGFVAAAYAIVDTTTREVVTGALPEPTDNAPVDSGSHVRDVNKAGVIVGGADVYDESVESNRRSVAVCWIPGAVEYTYQLLPLLNGDSYGNVSAINEAGEMVGVSQTFESGRAAYWSDSGASVLDLNDLLPLNSGWTLITADDINAQGQVVGLGQLGGVSRGYVLDLTTLNIVAVPLVTGAVENEAWQINDAGHVIGKANDDIVGGGPFPQGGWGYFWGGPGAEPQVLPSFTAGAAIARGINNQDELAGDSQLNGDSLMGLWQPHQGSFTVTDLSTQIPTKPVWDLALGFDLNDDSWVAGEGRKFKKGKYSWHGILLAPNP